MSSGILPKVYTQILTQDLSLLSQKITLLLRILHFSVFLYSFQFLFHSGRREFILSVLCYCYYQCLHTCILNNPIFKRKYAGLSVQAILLHQMCDNRLKIITKEYRNKRFSPLKCYLFYGFASVFRGHSFIFYIFRGVSISFSSSLWGHYLCPRTPSWKKGWKGFLRCIS